MKNEGLRSEQPPKLAALHARSSPVRSRPSAMYSFFLRYSGFSLRNSFLRQVFLREPHGSVELLVRLREFQSLVRRREPDAASGDLERRGLPEPSPQPGAR